MNTPDRVPVRICEGWDGEYLFTIDLVPHGDWVFLPGIATNGGRRFFDGDRALVNRHREAPSIAKRAAKYGAAYNPRVEA